MSADTQTMNGVRVVATHKWRIVLAAAAIAFAAGAPALNDYLQSNRQMRVASFAPTLSSQHFALVKSLPAISWGTSRDAEVPRDLWVFTGPDCLHCKKLDATLREIPGLRVHTILMPTAKALPLASSIWCSDDRFAALTAAMQSRTVPSAADCTTPFHQIESAANTLGITGTPTLVSSSGRIFTGYAARSVIENFAQ